MSSSLPNLEYLKFLDPHLSLKILDYLLKQNESDELKALYKILSIKTKNFEKIEKGKFLSESELGELKSKNEKETKDLENKISRFLILCDNCEKQNSHDLSLFSLGKNIIETTSPVDILNYGIHLFDINEYDKASKLLNSFSLLYENLPKAKSKTIFALYLLYSIKIYNEKYDEAKDTFEQINKRLEGLKNIYDTSFKKFEFDSEEKTVVDFKEILLYRGYLLHWALFLIKSNSALFLDIIFDTKNYLLVETSFGYLFKYIIVFCFIHYSRKNITKLKDSIMKKKNILNKNKDCFIVLLENILVNFDNKNAMNNLKDCKNLMKKDYFLFEYIDEFEKKVKKFILEVYLTLNECITIDEIKFIFDDDEEKTKKSCIDFINKNYPNSKVNENNNKIYYELNDDDINNYYKIKTDDLYSLTKNMIEVFKAN
jgi:hypothetical protein